MLNFQPPSPPLDRVFQALADPTRRSMLERLGSGPRSLGELAEPLPISLPAALQHLRVLEQAGLVVTRKCGRVRSCELRSDALVAADAWISARRAEWEQRLDRLGSHLASLPPQGDHDEHDE